MTSKIEVRPSKFVHRARDLFDLSAKTQKAVAARTGDIYQLKYDGCSAVFLITKDGDAVYSRQGKPCTSLPHITAELRKLVRPGESWVFFAEAWSPGREFPVISGEFRRKEPQPQLGAIVFDMIPYSAWLEGRCNIGYRTRFRLLEERLHSSYVNAGRRLPEYGAVLLPVDARSEDEAKHDLKRFSGRGWGLDGIIRRDPNAPWVAGDGACGSVLKIKSVVSVDLRCVDVELGTKGKFKDKVANVVCIWKGEHVPVTASCLTNEQRDALTAEPLGIIGKIVEVHALGLTPDGQLREGRLHRIRDDKTEPSHQ